MGGLGRELGREWLGGAGAFLLDLVELLVDAFLGRAWAAEVELELDRIKAEKEKRRQL